MSVSSSCLSWWYEPLQRESTNTESQSIDVSYAISSLSSLSFQLYLLYLQKKRLLSFVSTLWILAFLAVYWRPVNVNHISFNSQLNRLETLLSKENISLPLTEWALKDTNEESTKLIMWTLDGLVENYDKDKIINKIINYEYEDRYRSSRSSIREFLGTNTDYDYYYPTYKYRSYRQYGKEEDFVDVSWYSKILNFTKYYDRIDDMVLKFQTNNQEYSLNLLDHLDELKEKADLYAKSDLTDEEQEILKAPALEVSEENYKIIINWFSIEENKEWKTNFNNIEWYILIK